MSIMYARAEDLQLSPAPAGRAFMQRADRAKIVSCQFRGSNLIEDDDVDKIEVLEDSVQAIPIQQQASCKAHADRHLDLNVGSVHEQGQETTSLFQRRLQQHGTDSGLDAFSESDDSDLEGDFYGERSRGRGTQRQRLPHCRYSTDRRSRLQGRSETVNDRDSDEDSGSRHRARAPVRYRSSRPRTREPDSMLPVKPSSDQDAFVFDNFEDSASSSPSDSDNVKNQFETQLHFVRNAAPICGTPASAPLYDRSTFSCSDEDVGVAHSVSARSNLANMQQSSPATRPGGHVRRSSDSFMPTALVSAPTTASTYRTVYGSVRRRATLGSDAIRYRLSK
ncbi:hypothetical protein BCV70DRAFT_77007 [Testicularia cyperi]|uniref:Uncharacterized protein n=1 Tax=Testicularia cyperi TaxID=1882483 RepID=A0A317XTJ3_9BASI|nr:hypothetical protein BCV70DRAFT_77007 [Testicularia cyperi]